MRESFVRRILTTCEATCSSDLFIKIWDVQNEWKNTKTFSGHDHSISSVRFMPGDQQIVSASRDRTIRIFDVASTLVMLALFLLRACMLTSPQPSRTDHLRPFRLGWMGGTIGRWASARELFK